MPIQRLNVAKVCMKYQIREEGYLMYLRAALLALLTANILTLPVQATTRTYQASLSQATWRVSEYSALSCTLTHDIPRYGEIRFESQADRALNMRVVLAMKQLPDSYQTADVYSVAPAWRQQTASKKLGHLQLYRQYDSELGKSMAWTLLAELEQGMNPLFSYSDWYNEENRIQVQVSAVNFQKRYADFLDCVAQLLPFNFDDIAFTVLNYEAQTTELTAGSKRKLLRIGEYLKHDGEIEQVVVAGYTDSYGSYEENQALSAERAEAIKSVLLEAGLDESKIKVLAHGEMRHIAGNNNELERAKNRRVVIQIDRPFSKDLLSQR